MKKAMGTTEDGTDEPAVIEGMRSFGFVVNKYETTDQTAAWAWLKDCLDNERPVIACVMNWGHWVAVIGRIGNRIIIFDSSNTKSNKSEHGVHVLSRKEFIRRWSHSRNGNCSGISVGKK